MLRHRSTLPKIFVAMASYRDPEYQHTVRNLFAKAKCPERILVGICWQSPSRDKGGVHYKNNSDIQASNRPQVALKRMRHLLGVEETQNAEALVEIEGYGMGKVRTLKECWEFADIDLINSTIGEKAKTGRWTAFMPAKKAL